MADPTTTLDSVIDVLGASAMTVDELRAAFAERGVTTWPTDAHGVDELTHVTQLDESLTRLIDGRIAYLPAVARAVTWNVPIDDADAADDHLLADPHLTALSGWFARGEVTVVDAEGTPLGALGTNGFDVDGVDREVVIWPQGSLEQYADGVAAVTLVDEHTVQLATGTSVAPSDEQIAAVRAAFERCARTESLTGILADEPADVVTASSHDVIIDMLIAEPEQHRSAPLTPIPDLLAAADLELHGHRLVGPVGTDWTLLDDEFRLRRTEIEYGLTRAQANMFVLLTGAATARTDTGELALGDTPDEVASALQLVATMLDDADVAEAAWDHWTDLEQPGEPLQDIVDHLVDAFGDEPLAGVSWLRARQLSINGQTTEAVDVLERVADSEHALVLADLAAIEADRSNPIEARRLLDRAGVEGEIDLDAPFDPVNATHGFGVELAEEIAPFVALRPKPMAGRNDRCPCGSGRKYKQCHLGNELHTIEHRASWLYVKMMRYLGLVAPHLPTAIADDILGDVTDPGLRRMVTQSYLPTDMALHEAGLAGRFLDAKRALLPADEVALAEAWAESQRSVFEVARSTHEALDLIDLSTRSRLTVRESIPEEPLEQGWCMIGRLVPVGDSYRAYSGFIPINDDMVEPLLQGFATRQVETVAITIGSIFEAAETHDEMAEMFNDSLDLTELENLIAELGGTAGES
ncbi:YecA family protein [Ilumatobacter coccineus]|uniref:SEC-C domain-containing protein n=1 Tax=Ilumatobacter coccineus (strain NBRC 103263 / KCTC 29153 / YM16-304) TaxID=1313172 RepID=A0A6C7ECG1_ILUCY|nr:SEC-C metal-binding domain-containing protein [Ilumatobacter coccineus]BAN03692.1 hypothetical protein YM304_33780 [Ilumatobacter coccineus YM16-304]